MFVNFIGVEAGGDDPVHLGELIEDSDLVGRLPGISGVPAVIQDPGFLAQDFFEYLSTIEVGMTFHVFTLKGRVNYHFPFTVKNIEITGFKNLLTVQKLCDLDVSVVFKADE